MNGPYREKNMLKYKDDTACITLCPNLVWHNKMLFLKMIENANATQFDV